MRDLRACVAGVRDDREHGSRWLVRQVIQILYELATETGVAPAQRLQRVHQVGRELALARPAMAALAGACGRILATPGDPDAIAHAAHRLLQEYDQAIARIREFAQPFLQGAIMTHSLSSTVQEVFKISTPPLEQVIILEGRPLCEGRVVASGLAGLPLKLTLITDAQADIFLPMCRTVVVGADSILADGSVLNKAGTALLARAARSYGIPFYVLSETLKISSRAWSGDLSLLEEHPGQEVWRDAPMQVHVRNFYFDHTPADLVSGIVTEQGQLDLSEIAYRAGQLRDLVGSD